MSLIFTRLKEQGRGRREKTRNEADTPELPFLVVVEPTTQEGSSLNGTGMNLRIGRGSGCAPVVRRGWSRAVEISCR